MEFRDGKVVNETQYFAIPSSRRPGAASGCNESSDAALRRSDNAFLWKRMNMRHDIVPGAVFPDYQLPDHTGTPRRLSELQGDDPLILTLSRGHYCPKEHQQHLELAAFYPKIAVAIYPDRHDLHR